MTVFFFNISSSRQATTLLGKHILCVQKVFTDYIWARGSVCVLLISYLHSSYCEITIASTSTTFSAIIMTVDCHSVMMLNPHVQVTSCTVWVKWTHIGFNVIPQKLRYEKIKIKNKKQTNIQSSTIT